MGEYFLGLDLGTNSVGWAVTDKSYKVIKRHGKALWGIRLFEEAKTAKERRTFRTSRRRNMRKKWRIELLQELFADEINKVDDGFFQRLSESKYYPEDKRDKEGNSVDLPYALFVDADYTDKKYHIDFPTIYHLRQALRCENKQYDVRLVYLACHHIIKHRGHFLFEGSSFNVGSDFKVAWEHLVKAVEDVFGEESEHKIDISDDAVLRLEEILKDRNVTKTDKKKNIKDIIGSNTKVKKSIADMLCGSNVKLSDLFDTDEFNELEKKEQELCFSDSKYEENIDKVKALVGDRYTVIEYSKAIYDWSVLVTMLSGEKYYSDAKVNIYDKHREDLALLKKCLKDMHDNRASYNKMFVNVDGDNYVNYIGMAKKNGHKIPVAKKCTQEDFYKFAKEIIKNNKSNEAAIIKEEIEQGTFMPKQVVIDNGVVPYQLHKIELEEILDRASGYLDFLNNTDEDGITVKDKIISLLTFRIPYYVGPLNTYHKGDSKRSHAWAIRKESGRIYPWNFDKKIDKDESAKAFIQNMTNKCTYLRGEDVLPKNSILYNKFIVLNEINNIKINGEAISVDLKQQIYNNLCLKNKKVTQKKIKKYLVSIGKINKEEEKSCEITGIDGDIKASMTAYIDFKEWLTDTAITDIEKEAIIKDITLFGADKGLLKSRLEKLYPVLSDKQISRLCNAGYTGWGRFSEKLLQGITAVNPEGGEILSIIQMMWETNDNFMQILSNKYEFLDEINKFNADLKNDNKITYNSLDDFALSPAVKRPIWQSIKIVKEICKIMKEEPARIFIEVAREPDKNPKRTNSRKDKLKELYKNCKDETRDWIKELDSTEDTKFRSDRLFLYYTQMGKCPYCGKEIELGNLWDRNVYDIDHIYPQSKVMDDSLDNRVLVHKTCNEIKSDEYPIKPDIQKRMQNIWDIWKKNNFISEKKYARLTRKTAFDENELADFISRQLVETRQSTKALAEILGEMLPESKIVYSKAAVVSKFRQDFDMLKVREVNDLHHAKDAYLNIVCGNVYYVKFTKNPINYIKHDTKRTYNISKMFADNKNHDKQPVERNGEIAWIYGDSGTIADVKKQMRKNNILFTRMQHINAESGLFKQQIKRKGNGQVPIKSSDERLRDISKYGGYDKAFGAYFIVIEGDDKKGNRERFIETIPQYVSAIISSNEELEHYCTTVLGYKNPKAVSCKILIDSLISISGAKANLSGRSNKQLIIKNANQLVLSYEEEKAIKAMVRFADRQKKNKELRINEYDDISENQVDMLYKLLVEKLINGIYSNFSNLKGQGEFLRDKVDEYNALCLEDKVKLVLQIINMMLCDSTTSNLSILVDGGKSAGKLLIANNITEKNIKLIEQSVTGFYEKEVSL